MDFEKNVRVRCLRRCIVLIIHQLITSHGILPMNSPHIGQWREAFMFSLICVWIDGWVNNCEAGDLRRHRVHRHCNGRGWHEDGIVFRWPCLRMLNIISRGRNMNTNLDITYINWNSTWGFQVNLLCSKKLENVENWLFQISAVCPLFLMCIYFMM